MAETKTADALDVSELVLPFETSGKSTGYRAAAERLSKLDSTEQPDDEDESEEIEIDADDASDDNAHIDDEDDDSDVDEDEEDPDDEDVEEEEDDEDDEVVDRIANAKRKLTVDGKEVELTVAELEKGYLRTADYTRKTQAVAEERKAVSAEKETVAKDRQRYVANLQQVEAILKDLQPEPSAEEMEELRRANPGEYSALKEDLRERREALAAVAAEREKAEREAAAERQAAFNEYAREEAKKLYDLFPEWKDEKKRTAAAAAMRETALELGFTDEELEATVDHRVIRMLDMVRQYQALQKKRDGVREKIAKVKTLKAGTSTTTEAARRKAPKRDKVALKIAANRLTRTGDVRDGAAAILALDL